MGVWGYAPWDSDAAADWFGDLLEQSKLAESVAETLKRDPEEYAEEIRAASALLIMLGRSYIWPIDDLDNHLDLAISQMQKIQAMSSDSPELSDAISEELSILVSRRNDTREQPERQRPDSWGDFW